MQEWVGVVGDAHSVLKQTHFYFCFASSLNELQAQIAKKYKNEVAAIPYEVISGYFFVEIPKTWASPIVLVTATMPSALTVDFRRQTLL